MEFLYNIFIYPLEYLMKITFEKMLFLTDNYLFSLIFLSFIVTFVSWPVYRLAESWQEKEREIQKKLKPKIVEFKSIFKGAVLNRYVSTLYRQNSYHPIFAVRTSFGLLIQIPFFFAAYHLLSNYSGFINVETFLFKDLSQPDSLVNLGFITANLMPFVMTAINIISAAIYSKKTSKKESFQVYGMAILFLIILYDASSALLFYWTFNNIFSLLRNLVEENSDRKKLKISTLLLKIKPNGWTQFILILISMVSFFCLFNSAETSENSIEATILTFLPVSIVLFFMVFSVLNSRILSKVFLRMFKIIPTPQYNFKNDTLFNISTLCFSVLAFIAVPLAVLSSGSESDFEEPLLYFLSYVFIFASLFYVLCFVFYKILPKNWKMILSVFSVFMVFYSLANVFVFTGNYGDMSHFIFNEGIETEILEIIINSTTAVVLFVTIFFLFIKFKTHYLKPILSIILFSLILFCVNESKAYYDKRKDTTLSTIGEGEYFYTFSKTGKNVIVLMLDRFVGGFMPQILEFMPNLQTDLDGFVYYKNSLSSASYTIGGVPPIMGGWDYTIKNVNSTRQDVPLLKKLDESSRILPYNFDREGFDVKVYRTDCINWFDKTTNWIDKENREYLGNSLFIEPDYPKFREKWLEKYEKESRKGDDQIRKKLIIFGVFRTAPVFLREFIYDDGEWHIEKDDSENEKFDEKLFVSARQKSKYRRDTTLKYYAVLDLLPDYSKVDESFKSQYMFLSNNLTHEPHSINSDFEFDITGNVIYPRYIFNRFNRNLSSVKHLYTDGAAIRMVNKWLKWMKENDVYDNTRIIIVSDHGRDIYNPFFKEQRIPGTRKKAHPAYFNNLMLIKDFNSRGELQIKDEFMTSADVPFLATKDLFEAINPYTGKKIQIPENKFPFYAYDVQWRVEKQEKFKYVFHEGYEILEEKHIHSPSQWSQL